MGNFNLTITNEGAAFLADVIVNHGTINFSEVRFSSTNYVGSEAGLTAGTFAGTFITAVPSASVMDSTTINVAAAFTNATFTADESLYSIGVIADDGNGTDYLIAVATTSTPDILSKLVLSVSTYAYNINLGISSTDNITVTASTAGAVFVADIIDNLTSENTNKPLSAKQGKVLKDMIDQHGGGILPHIVIISETGSVVTLTKGQTVVSATETSTGHFEADVPEFGTWVIDSVLAGDDAQVSLVVDVVKIYTVDDSHFNANITVSYPSAATCSLSITGLTPVYATGSPFTFTVHSAATYTLTATINGTSRTKTVTITTSGQTETETFLVDGSTVTPVDVISTWLDCAYLWDKNYTTLAEVIADSEALLALISDHNAVDYMVRSVSFRTAICSDPLAMLYIGQYNYCADALLADSTWLTEICNSEYFELVLNTKVPVMTSNTTPSGECFASSSYTANGEYLAFDRSETYWNGNSTTPIYLGYKFDEAIRVNKAGIRIGEDHKATSFTIRASNDNTNWTDLATLNVADGTGDFATEIVFANNTEYLYYEYYWTTHLRNDGQDIIREVQFYGRTDVDPIVSRDLKTFATANNAEILEMVCKADRGEMDLYDDAGWRVGQEHSVDLAPIIYDDQAKTSSASVDYTVGETQPAQTVTLVLSNKGGKTLTNSVLDKQGQTRTECIFQWDLKDGLSKKGYINSTSSNTGSWKECARRAWCNYGFYNALPPCIRACTKSFKVLTAQTYNGSTNETVDDYCALRAEKEVQGSRTYSNQTEANALTQATYYETSSNRIKKIGSDGSADSWFERSPQSTSNQHFCAVQSDGTARVLAANGTACIAPFGCF